MKAVTTWSFRPYQQVVHKKNQIYICRLEPFKTGVTLDWLRPEGYEGDFTVCWRVLDGLETAEMPVSGTTYTITGLLDKFDYEVFVLGNGYESSVRLVRPSDIGGKVINYLHPEDSVYGFAGKYLSSPSIIRCKNGDLLASMDIFDSFAPDNLTLIYRSRDNGATWEYSCELFPCFWGKMFVHKGDVYMFANSNEYGDLLIGRSTDNGHTFEMPTVLFRSSCNRAEGGLHKNVVPFVEHSGRLWSSIEYGTWEKGGKFHYMLISADANGDLMDPASWELSEPLVYDHNWPGAAKGLSRGAIEGNTVIAPDGKLMCMLRYEIAKCDPAYGLALMLEADTSSPDKPMKFNGFAKFTANKVKFTVIRDEKSGYYYTIGSRLTGAEGANYRNLLSFYRSKDLYNWEVLRDLIDYTDRNPRKYGAQYVDSIIDGDDLIWLCRQGYGGANSFHNSNYITCHVLKNFRDVEPEVFESSPHGV